MSLWLGAWREMWIFGGRGPSAVGDVFLNDYGDFVRLNPSDQVMWYNNQLLSYDPSMNIWKSVKPSGDIRHLNMLFPQQESAIQYGCLLGKIFLITPCICSLYELNMNTFSWTKIQTPIPRQKNIHFTSLTPITANQLVLHCAPGIDHDKGSFF